MELKYFKVTCKCGHVGRSFFIRIDFPVAAQSRKEASSIARQIPRVKHHHKDAILACVEITYEEYEALQEKNRLDPYLRCKNPQEQEKIFGLRLRLEPEVGVVGKGKKNKRASVEYRLKKQTIVEESAWDYDYDEVLIDRIPALA